jgi:hypothetical protein
MLGYRQELQARSIAHGCTTTLVALAREDQESRRQWGIDERCMTDVRELDEIVPRLRRLSRQVARDRCWLRPERVCPFSTAALTAAGADKAMVQAVSMIHELCWQTRSHTWKT